MVMLGLKAGDVATASLDFHTLSVLNGSTHSLCLSVPPHSVRVFVFDLWATHGFAVLALQCWG